MRWIAMVLAVSGGLTLVTGCGGGLSQEDMRRHAIRRSGGADSSDDKQAAPGQATKPSDKEPDAKGAAMRPPQPKSPPPPEVETKRVAEAAAPAISGTADPATTETPVETTPAPASLTQEPAAPLTPNARRQRSVDNLTQIGDALRRYSQEEGRLFARAICNAQGQPLLSWRVELLPYLGEQALYDQFDLTQPWDSARNLPFAKLIPSVYQSPERLDEKTNYLVPVASFTPFGNLRGLSLRNFEDGPENTIVLLEADDAAAVAWTKPADLNINLKAHDLPFGNLRENGFFAVWGDGSVTRVAAERSGADLKAILSYDGGDAFAEHLVRASTSTTPALSPIDTGDKEVAQTPPAAKHSRAALAQGTGRRPNPGSQSTASTRPARLPVPDTHSLERARELVRDIYQHDYENARTVNSQKALAQLMLKQISDLADDPAGQYVVLDIVTQISTQTGDSVTALDAMQQMLALFEIDELTYRHDVLQQLAKGKDRGRAVQQKLREEATALVDTAIEAEDFDMAESLCQIASRAARQLGDNKEVAKIEQQRELVEETRKAHRTMQRIIATLEDAEDPQANLEVGRYYCLLRGNWQKGLSLLAKGNDAQLKALATIELQNPTQPTEQVELADGWWDLSSKDETYRRVLRLHAAHWYQRAESGLPQGLLRVKAELRVAQVEREYGSTALAAVASDGR